jgi:hypothetical protein
MTRKDFQALADILGRAKKEMEGDILQKDLIYDNLQFELIAFCARRNENFDRARFVAAIEKAAK